MAFYSGSSILYGSSLPCHDIFLYLHFCLFTENLLVFEKCIANKSVLVTHFVQCGRCIVHIFYLLDIIGTEKLSLRMFN